MGCPIGTWEGAVKGYMEDTGASEEEAKKMVSSWMGMDNVEKLTQQLIDGRSKDATKEEFAAGRKAEATLLMALDNEGTQTDTRKAIAKAIVDNISKDDLLAAKGMGLIKNWDAISQAAGYADWTKGEAFNKLRAYNDTAYLATFIERGNTEAIGMLTTAILENDNTKVEHYIKGWGMDENAATITADAWRNAKIAETLDTFTAKAKTTEKTGQQLALKLYNGNADVKTAYDSFYSDYRNIKTESIQVNKEELYPKMEWMSGIGIKFEQKIVDAAGRVFNPLLRDAKGRMVGGFDERIKAEIKYSKDYKSMTLSFNTEKYIEDLKSGKYLVTNIAEEQAANEVLSKIVSDYKNTEYWSCSGTLCDAFYGQQQEQEQKSSGGGGGGSSGGSSGYRSSSYGQTVENDMGSLYIECNVTEASVWVSGEKKGNVNEIIQISKGTYKVEVKATGYTTRSTSVTIGDYAVSKTMNLTKKTPSISIFINGIGGIQNLTKEHYLYLFCIYKMRKTSAYSWKQLADSVISIQSSIIPQSISNFDVMYIYYVITGDTTSANGLVADGKVTLEQEEDDENTDEGIEAEPGV